MNHYQFITIFYNFRLDVFFNFLTNLIKDFFIRFIYHLKYFKSLFFLLDI